MSDTPMKLALLGAGMLGGSFALALKEAGKALTITAYDPLPAHTEQLRARGGADRIATTAADAVRDADIVLLAAPVGSYRAIAQQIAPALQPGTILTDVGSVKSSMAALEALLPNTQIVPGHPIAGSEKSGPEAARADLFRDRLLILTPHASTNTDALAIVTALWHAAGADVIQMPVALHDQIYAYVSHLPHFIAFVAASYFHQIGVIVRPEDAMLQQFLRISRSNPRMWTDVALENREALLPVLATYTALLEHFAAELRAGEPPATPVDSIAAAKTLVPRILAASLISTVSLHEQQSGANLRPFAAGGMRDIAAPAAITPEEDTEAISNAAPVVADHIAQLAQQFHTLEALLGAADGAALFTHIERLIAEAHLLVMPRN